MRPGSKVDPAKARSTTPRTSKTRILAGRRMGRTDPINDPAAWALGYEETSRGCIWRGRNCYPEPLNE